MENAKHQPLLSGGLKHLPAAGGVEINGVGDIFREVYVECKRVWYLAGPVIFTSLCQYSIGATTQLFAGHLGTTQLAAASVQNSVFGYFCYSILFGMGCALSTLCGQAYGAGKVKMLGIYLQRSWILLNTAALALLFTYIFSTSILRLFGQTTAIATAAGKFTVWTIPQLFAYATVIPLAKFLQSQSNILPMAFIAMVAVISHVGLSWVLIMKLGWGLAGAALVLDGSWWFITLALLAYVLWGSCGEAWSGFSWKAFRNLKGFVHVSFATSIMYCLQPWYMMSLVLLAGHFQNPEASLDALSVCLNILGWFDTFSLGLNIAVSVRVANELGYGRPRAARFAVLVVVLTSLMIGILSTTLLIVHRTDYPMLFTNSPEVRRLVEELTLFLGASITVNSTTCALSGVTIGAGWQTTVAYLNIGSYFLFGIPMSLLLGFKLDMGVKGMWYGMLSGSIMQCCLLITMVCRTNWSEEANAAGHRILKWGGDNQGKEKNEEKTIK